MIQYSVALHETGHALGYAHEQNRGDRNLYVKLEPENADESKWQQNKHVVSLSYAHLMHVTWMDQSPYVTRILEILQN